MGERSSQSESDGSGFTSCSAWAVRTSLGQASECPLEKRGRGKPLAAPSHALGPAGERDSEVATVSSRSRVTWRGHVLSQGVQNQTH